RRVAPPRADPPEERRVPAPESALPRHPRLGGVSHRPPGRGRRAKRRRRVRPGDVSRRQDRRGSAPPFWTGWPGVTAGAFDVPHLSTVGAADDVRVSTWGTHSLSHPRASHPPGLIREIDATFGRHPAFGDEHRYAWHRPEFVDWLVRSLVAGSARRADIAAWL